MRLDLALHIELHQLAIILAVILGLALGEGTPEHANDLAPFEERQIERNARNFAIGKTDHKKASVPGGRPQRGFGEIAADRIIDHISTRAIGQRLDPFLQIFGTVIDQLVRAMLLAQGELVIGRGGGDHPCAHCLAKLDRGKPHAAGSAEHEQGFARLELAALLQPVIGGAIGQQESRRGLKIHRVGDRDDAGGAGGHLLRIAAITDIGKHPVTDRKVIYPFANRTDNAGHLGPW